MIKFYKSWDEFFSSVDWGNLYRNYPQGKEMTPKFFADCSGLIPFALKDGEKDEYIIFFYERLDSIKYVIRNKQEYAYRLEFTSDGRSRDLLKRGEKIDGSVVPEIIVYEQFRMILPVIQTLLRNASEIQSFVNQTD